MKDETLRLLRCVVTPSRTVTDRSDRSTDRPAACCAGRLYRKTARRLACARCGARYPIHRGIPWLLPPDQQRFQSPHPLHRSHYLDDEIIQCYYEAHYSPFIRHSPAALQRLSFPQPGPMRRSLDGHRVENLSDGLAQRDASTERRALYQSVEYLATTPRLTEDFYQHMLEWCRPFVRSKTLVLDVGCGLGRMTGELARMGARYVLGLDRSPRMAAEAARVLGARGPLRLPLNLVGAETARVTLDIPLVADNCGVLVADSAQLPVAPATFDLITCLNVLDRIPDAHRMIVEFTRALKPGGHLVIADPYHWEEQYTPRANWVTDMAGLFDLACWRRVREADGVPFVMRYYSRRVTVYMNHCLIYQKTRGEGRRRSRSRDI